MSVNITHCYSIGRRCTTRQILETFKLQKDTGPLDWCITDFETSIDLINTSFKHYVNDIIMINKSKPINILLFKKYTNKSNIKFNIQNRLIYNQNDWSNVDLFFNNYYSSEIPYNNIHDMSRVLLYMHHNFKLDDTISTLTRRKERFVDNIKNYSNKILLFYISNILDINNYIEYRDSIKQNIERCIFKNCYFVIILCVPGINNYFEYFKDNIIIYKNVPSKEMQYKNKFNDNDIEFVNYLDIVNILKNKYNL